MLGVFNSEINKSFNQLFSHILTEQQLIDSVRPAKKERQKETQEILGRYTKLKGRGLVYDYLSSGKGHGPFTELLDGSVKYDLIGGIGVNILGHSHPLYIKSHLEAALSDTVMCGNLLTYQESFQLTQTLLAQVTKSRLKHFWFAGSGSFANDTALKILWQQQFPKKKIIAFDNSFAGRSVATQEITHNKNYRYHMPQNLEVYHVPHFDYQNEATSLGATLAALNKLWDEKGDQFCCLMIELVQGEAGFIYGTKDFYEKIFKWAQEKKIPIWIDEVQTFMRTRELFSFQMFGLDEYVDIVTVGKALQTCGVLYSEELNPKPGLIAGTFNGALAALKVGKKTIDFLTQSHFYGEKGRIVELEKAFLKGLNRLKQTSCAQKIGYIGGIGTMISFEVGDSSTETTRVFLLNLFENGIIAFSAGAHPTRVRFLLPLCLTVDHIQDIFIILEKTIVETIETKTI